jgi:hypothetical protein
MLKAILATLCVALILVPSTTASRISEQQARAKPIICKVFGSYCSEALDVSWCESKWYVWAVNPHGDYRGLFQMGRSERAKYGHGPGAWAQSRAAYRYFVDSGRDWSPWSCQP